MLEVKGLAGTNANRGESGPDLCVFRRRWDELEGKVEILEEVVLDPLAGGREESDRRRGRWRGLLEERGKRLPLVTRLHLLDVRHVPGIEELGPKTSEREWGRR